jgi:hypothetical protein
MSIKSLRKYGIVKRAFKGKGTLKLKSGTIYRCRITLGQFTNANLLICADINCLPIEFFFRHAKDEVEELKGTLLDERPIQLVGPIYLRKMEATPNKQNSRLIIHVSQCVIGGLAFVRPATVSFDISNFLFNGTEIETHIVDGQEQSDFSLLPLKVRDREIQIRKVSNYKEIETILWAQKGVETTCIASTSIDDPTELDEITSVMDTICDVASVARGTLINWNALEVKTIQGNPVYLRYRDSVIRRYASFELIKRDNIQQSKDFLERGCLRCIELANEFQIKRIARAFTETRDGPFIETRSLLIAVLTEYLAGIRSRLDNRVYFMEENMFMESWETVRNSIGNILSKTYPEVKREFLRAMVGNAKGLNRRPFSWQINNLAKWLDIKFDKVEIDRFIATRNSLAHTGSFPKDGTPVEHYKRMQHFLDRIMLRLFDYHGNYYDFDHNKISEI